MSLIYWVITTFIYFQLSVTSGENTPTKIYEDPDFHKCQSKGFCTVKSKCHFSVVDEDTNSTVSGNVFFVSNGMKYPITFYWDIFYAFASPGTSESTTISYGTIFALPGRITYFDSGTDNVRAIRLYVPSNSDPYGRDLDLLSSLGGVTKDQVGTFKTVETNAEFHMHTEHVQTLSLTNSYEKESKCTKEQACRLLMSVCYSAPAYMKERCQEYETGCGHFDLEWVDPREEMDSLARDSYLNEYVMEYYGYVVNVDADVVVAWMIRGGGAKGGDMDGYSNVQFFMLLGVLLYLMGISVLYVTYKGIQYKRRFKDNGGHYGGGKSFSEDKLLSGSFSSSNSDPGDSFEEETNK